jgi:hypothetical protein
MRNTIRAVRWWLPGVAVLTKRAAAAVDVRGGAPATEYQHDVATHANQYAGQDRPEPVRQGAWMRAVSRGLKDMPLNVHLPVDAETYDGYLSDIEGLAVTRDMAFEALESAASGAIEEGNVGGGAGMICHEFKGGTGTASRVVAAGYTVGALVQANYGRRVYCGSTVFRVYCRARAIWRDSGGAALELARMGENGGGIVQ